MSMVEKTLHENYLFFTRELARIDDEIGKLPSGGISPKRIGNSTYYYHQWREGRRVRSVSLGAAAPQQLVEGIARRKQLEQQRKEVLKNIHVLGKAIDVTRATADEIIKVFAEHGVRTVLIGSHCLPIFKDRHGFHVPTIKTQDIDFLIKAPYRGKDADIEALLKGLGFSRGFNLDGSTYFSNGSFKVEFLVPEKGRGTDKAVPVKSLHIQATPLRYVQMLLDEPEQITKDGHTFLVPSPWSLAFHKFLVAGRRKDKAKKEKDILQAVSLLREICARPELLTKAKAYLKTLPKTWTRQIRAAVAEHLPECKL
jgi:hypothetical protein